jgi:fructose-1,6-bisphosphatase/inositol monophosphatase family enzyme
MINDGRKEENDSHQSHGEGAMEQWCQWTEQCVLPVVREASRRIVLPGFRHLRGQRGGYEHGGDEGSFVHSKPGSSMDLVTAYDVACERFLQERLPRTLPPELLGAGDDSGMIGFEGEEGEANCADHHCDNGDKGHRDHNGRRETFEWVVDPIDGTCNFVHGLPAWSISVALCRRVEEGDGAGGSRRPIVGVLQVPFAKDLFPALHYQRRPNDVANDIGSADEEVTVNAHEKECEGEKEGLTFWTMQGLGHVLVQAMHGQIGVIQPRRWRPSNLRECLVSVEWGNALYDPDGKLGPLLEQTRRLARLPVHGLRAVGCATVNILLVALGQLDVFFEHGLKAWDVAAAALLAQELGCHIGLIHNGDHSNCQDYDCCKGHHDDDHGENQEGKKWSIDSGQILVACSTAIAHQIMALFTDQSSS